MLSVKKYSPKSQNKFNRKKKFLKETRKSKSKTKMCKLRYNYSQREKFRKKLNNNKNNQMMILRGNSNL